MKTSLLIPLFAACTGLLCAEPPSEGGPRPGLPASISPGGDPTGGGKHDKMRDKMRDKMMDNMPPEIRARFDAARDKAMQDPKIQELKAKADAAGDEFRKAMREAIMKADPGLAEILKEQFKGKMKDGKPGEKPGFANLSEGDRQKLMAAREKAKDDPAVKAAEAKKSEAKTPEERQAAMEAFHKAMKDALLKADPTIGPLLEQLKPPHGGPGRPPGPPPGGNPGMPPEA